MMLWLIIFSAVAVRIFLLFYSIDDTSIEFADGVHQAIVGRNIISGQGITDLLGPHTVWPPFYPFLIGIVSLAVPDLEMAGRLVSLASGIFGILFLYLITRELFSGKAALFAALFLALSSHIARASLAVLSESTYIFVLLAAIWVALVGLRKAHPGWFLASGLLLGCAYLTRPEAIGFAGIALLVVFGARAGEGRQWRGGLIGALALIFGFLIVAAPYIGFLRAHTGSWQLSGKTHLNLAVTDPRLGDSPIEQLTSLTADGSQFAVDTVTTREILEYWRDRPLRFINRYGKLLLQEYRSFLPIVFHPLLFAFLGIGLYHGRWRQDLWGKLLCLAAVYTVFVYPLSHLQLRYMLPVVPFLLIWSGHGAARVAETLSGLQPGRRLGWLATRLAALSQVALVLFLVVLYRDFVDKPFQLGPEAKRVGRWIGEHVGPGARIMETFHNVAFHAEGIPIQLPYAPTGPALRYGACHSAQFLVIGESYSLHPDLKRLLDPANAPPGLGLVRAFEPSAESGVRDRTVLYRLPSCESLAGAG